MTKQQLIQNALDNLTYRDKDASLLLGAAALAGHGLLGHIGQNILSHFTMTTKPFLASYRHHFHAGLRGLNVTEGTAIAKGVLAPAFMEAKITADHMHELGHKFGEALHKRGLSVHKLDHEHYDFLHHLTKGNFNIAAQKLKQNQAKLHPILESLTHAAEGVASAKGLHEALRAVHTGDGVAMAKFSPLYKKSMTAKILNHVVKPITHSETGTLARAAKAKPTQLGNVAEAVGNAAIATHDPGIAMWNATKRFATSEAAAKASPVVAKVQKGLADYLFTKPILQDFARGVTGKTGPTSAIKRNINRFAFNPAYADVAALSQDAGHAFANSKTVKSVKEVAAAKAVAQKATIAAKDTVANMKYVLNNRRMATT